MKRLFFIFLLFISFQSKASHIIGGDIYYNYLGNNQYRFFITLYRDCNSTGAAYDDPLALTIFLANGAVFQNLDVPFPGSVILPNTFNNPCATPPSNICVERAIYTIVVTLPPIVGGYNVSYQRCCRGPNISNLVNPDNTGITLTTHVPGSETGFTVNSSPRFTNYPPILLCNTEQLIFNHVATDPDGDQLVYSLVTPFAGANSVNPMPNQAPPPPYVPVQWDVAYSAANPLGPGSNSSINPTTGILNVTPNMIGLFVVGVRVQEYRNGVLIGETVRDFLFRVFNCNITLQALLPTQDQLPTFISYCQGLNVSFVNNSFGGSTYAWDFGVLTTTSDVSSLFSPSYTYPGPGNYTARLIVNPGMPCTDTAYMDIIVDIPFIVSWSAQDSICITSNDLNFIGQTSHPNASYSWTFDPDASIQNPTTINVQNVNFTTPGFHTVLLNGINGDCQSSFVDSIFIVSEPIGSIFLSPNIECDGLTVQFQTNVINTNFYQWDFGVLGTNLDQSSLAQPSYSYLQAGTYTIQLVTTNIPGCSDTTSLTINLNEPLAISFTHSDSLCGVSELYDFNASASGPASTQYSWYFGPNSIPNSAATLDVFGVQFTSSGNQEVMLIGTYEDCADTVISTVFVYGEPEINFSYLNSLLCAPATAQFVNLSQTDAPVLYTWDFGDGGTSTDFSPGHLYTSEGNYSVGLTMITLAGCIDTLYMLQQDIINIYPKPTAGFSVSPQETDICEALITFSDLSQGANSYYYNFDNNGFTSSAANFSHNYITSGSDYPIQIVTNQYGCKDTMILTLIIQPISLYIPNTFTPDEDEHNTLFKPTTDFEIFEWQLRIYNRWGELVFQSNDYSIGWDGHFGEIQCQDGIYSYDLQYRSCEQEQKKIQVSGHVNLIR
jgi:gliding motility-associated-like protein